MKNYRIDIRVEAKDRETTIVEFEKLIAQLKKGGWIENSCGGGGGDGPDFGIYIGERPRDIYERIDDIEAKLAAGFDTP